MAINFDEHIDYDALAYQRKVHVFGDWHGDLEFARRSMAAAGVMGTAEQPVYIIHVGDLTLGNHSIEELNRILTEEFHAILLLSDGNHDDHIWLANLSRDRKGLGEITSNVHHVPRGTILPIARMNVAFMGGTSSVNRANLIPGYDWWSQEVITQADLDKLRTQVAINDEVDVLITHDAPYGGKLIEKCATAWAHAWPEADVALSTEQRKLIAEAITIAQPKILVHGHWHMHYAETREDGTRVIGLADNNNSEFMFQNSVILNYQPATVKVSVGESE